MDWHGLETETHSATIHGGNQAKGKGKGKREKKEEEARRRTSSWSNGWQ